MISHSIRRCAFAALSLAFVGCSDGASVSEEVASSEERLQAPGAALALGDAIAAHPLFAPLSDRVNGELAQLVQSVSKLDAAGVAGTLAALGDCAGRPAPACSSVLAELGITPAEIAADKAAMSKIAVDVGLHAVPAATRDAALRRAQGSRDGAGGDTLLVTMVVAGSAFSCGAACRETLGNVLGAGKSAYLARASGGDDSGPAASSGGGGPTPVEVAGWIGVVISVVEALEDWIWDSNEEDKECVNDADCSSNEFCHKIGENDCRPAHKVGHLCDRAAQCLSNCCKPHISTGFLPSCRPADKCD